MRPTGLLHPTDNNQVIPDYVNNIIATAASSAYAQDLASSLGSSNPGILQIRTDTMLWLKWGSTGVVIPTTNRSSGEGQELYTAGVTTRQVPGASTGYSVAFGATGSSGIASFSFWLK